MGHSIYSPTDPEEPLWEDCLIRGSGGTRLRGHQLLFILIVYSVNKTLYK